MLLQKLKRLFRKETKLPENNAYEIVYKNGDAAGYDNLVSNLNNYFSKHSAEKGIFKKELAFLNMKFEAAPGVEKIYYSVIPYPFILQYDYHKLAVHRDEEAGMFYVFLDGKKLYYHKGFTNIQDVQKSFTFISIEQHPDSPHRYLDDFFAVNENDVVADIGAAEGNFSLMVVDKVKKLIIVETEPIWIEALQKTFEPWKDKVKIVNKFVGETNNEHTITLDKLEDEHPLTVIKMDIEGAETGVLRNAESYIREKDIKMAVTVYHKQTDADEIKALVEKNGYETVFSKGYMLFIHDTLRPPYFRHGLIKAGKPKLAVT
jgi:Methyltransferase FkbM domain